MTTVIIADDEPLLRFHLQKSLADVWPEAEVIAQAANGDEAWSLIAQLKPDVVFLDIHMPGLSGLEVALYMSQADFHCQIVFLTAFDEYAIQAFDRGAVDYLLKPLDEKRLAQTVQRIEDRQIEKPTQRPEVEMLLDLVGAHRGHQHLTWLNAQQGEAIKIVHVDDVLYLRAEDKYTTLVCAEGEFLLRLSIKQLEEQLDSTVFWRIHRGTLVNIKHVDRVEKNLSGQCLLYLRDVKKPLMVSRAKQHLFKAH